MIPAVMIDRARSTRLEDELFRRSINLSDGIAERCGPCPVCGGKDRFAINVKKQLFNCRGCGARGGDAIALVQFLDGLSFGEAVRMLTGAAPQKPVPGAHHGAPGHRDSGEPPKAATQPPDNARTAARLWGAREPITEGCPAGLYLRRARRFDGPIPPTLGYLPPNGKYPPAMIAAFGFCDEPEPGLIDPPGVVTGVHLTRLTRDGLKAAADPVKIMLGPSAGLPIVLAPANDLLAIDIAEGIEKGLLIQADTAAGMWAAGSAGNMPALAAVLPAYVECVTIWADRDETGLRFSRDAARIIQARKIDVRIKGIPNAERLRHG